MRKVLHVLPHRGGGAETYIDLLERLPGYAHARVPLSVTRSRLAGVPSVASRLGLVRRLAADAEIVHLHGDMAAMLAARTLRGRPLVITSHGLHRLRRSTGLAGLLVRRRLAGAVAASARTICIAADEVRDLRAALPPSLHGRLALVPNGVPLPAPRTEEGRRRARRELQLPEDGVVALFVGQLEERKDPLGAIDAVEEARRRGAPLTLLLAGSGPLEARVRARHGAAARALGHRDDLDRLYAAADLFLLPSHREGMSFALLEAMAHGLAPLVADGTGNRETVGAAGVVFAPGDRAALAARLTELAADGERRAALGAAARERVERQLSLERFLAGTRAQYEAALAAQGA